MYFTCKLAPGTRPSLFPRTLSEADDDTVFVSLDIVGEPPRL